MYLIRSLLFVFHCARDLEIESGPRNGRQINSLTRLHLRRRRQRHANESICVCPQGTDGIPGAEVQLAFDYRSSSGATATQSDTVWPARGNDDIFWLIYPGDCLEKKQNKTKNRKEPSFLSRPISKENGATSCAFLPLSFEIHSLLFRVSLM